MNPEDWRRVKELFEAGQSQPAGHRARWLAAACDQPHIRAEVESLLAAGESAGEFIERPPVTEIAAAVTGLAETPTGHTAGPWRLVEQIGHGGMGTVWLGVRADGAFEKQVAVKLVSRGLDTEVVLRRFQQERRILASLNHPHITALLDGGTTADGLPYFVMEYVAGRPITAYCCERALPLRARLELFCIVCDAVEYAHRNRVLHRDLKPSNILVTTDGVPKLLDFGIAKLLNEGSEPGSTLTIRPLQVLTPEYASPEQVRAEPASESGDVYSLGVLLYELVAGRRPYEFQTRSPEEIATVVCEREPVKPSAAVRQPRLKGDLDSIVMMALRKEARFRYGSVAAFSLDLRSYLQGRPVRAVRQTYAYRTGKFLRRQGARVAAALAVLLIMAGMALWQRIQRQAPAPGGSYRRSAVAEANDYYERAIAVDKADWDLPRMIRLLQHAVDLDPNFTAGRSRYGFYQLLMIDGGLSGDPVWLDRAETELKRVEREDPNSALNHAYLAALSFYRRRWDEVENHANTAVRLDPAEVDARVWLNSLLRLRGDWPQAIRLGRQMLERDPACFPARMGLAASYRYSGDLEASIRENEKTLEQNARLIYAIAGLACAHLDRGDPAMARQMLGRARPEDRGNYVLRLAWALLLAREGNAGAARREADKEVLRWAELFPECPVMVAEVYSVLGDAENALAWLEKAVRGGDHRKSWLLRDPHLTNVRKYPRFQLILDSIPSVH
ncbi:MAG: protein kinase [Acidobacteria bacterium]|nr:protein kinase [Acidobacteriota bacterium]